MNKDRRLTISLTEEQYQYIKKIALVGFEGRLSAVIRKLINEAIKKAPEK